MSDDSDDEQGRNPPAKIPVTPERKAPESQARSVRSVAVSRQTYKGPIPPPSYLAEYAAIDRDLPARIIGMAEKEQTHRHKQEDAIVIKGLHTERWGIVSGWTIAVLFLVASAWLISKGFAVPGTVLGTVDLLSLVSVFVKMRQPKEESAPPSDSDGA